MKPSTGDEITVLARLICSSSSRAFDCSMLRAGEIELRDGGLVARFGVVVGLAGE